VIIHTIETRTHGRYLVDCVDARDLAPMLVGFHGYGETAEHMLTNLRALARGDAAARPDEPGGAVSDWCLVSVQALHRFYTRSQEVAANWMTRQDRELEIESNTAYVWSVVYAVQRDYRVRRPLVFAGFSQGVAMAYRAAAAGSCDGLILLAGDVPPDVASRASGLPPILLGRGTKDEWYTEQKATADARLLRDAGVSVTEHVFDAGHVWDESFVTTAQQFLQRVVSATP
jgi:predicted esterase